MLKWFVAGAILGPAAAIGLAAGPQVQQAATGTQPVGIIHNSQAIQAFVQASAQRRVDIAGIGDSNQLSAGTYGHDHGVQKAWASARGMYGTGVLPFAGYNLSSWPAAGQEYYASSLGSAGFSTQTPPPQLAQYALSPAAGFVNLPYAYLADSESITSTASHYQLSLPPSTPFNTSDKLRWHYTYGIFANGTGSFQPSARQEATGNVLGSKSVNPVTGAYGLADDYFELPAATRDFTIGFEPFALNGNNVEGPFFAQYQRAESVDASKGVAYSTLLAQGGRSALHAAQSLQSAPDPALREWLRQAVRLQSGDPTLMVNLIHGGNDRNFSAPSVGPNSAPSNTGPGFADNAEAIINRLRGAWTAQGYDVNDMFFVIGAYHPQPGFEQNLADFETGAMTMADRLPNVAVVRGSRLVSAHTMATAGYYASAADNAHLSPRGYEEFDRLAVKQLISGAQQIAGLSNVSQLAFDFDADILASLEASDLLLENQTAGYTVNPADLSVSYDPATHTATWTFPGLDQAVLPFGHYKATLGATDLTDSGGTPINDGANYVYTFDAIPDPAGALLAPFIGGCWLLKRHRRGGHTAAGASGNGG